ncbi:Patatin like protein [Phytophthora palmivora]|uniref:Patatin like protein n=1 Tax=Phytophthora palmivora TaxID=4796 RepID=A0A2P4XI93_9STRA|nr:Patatin like protein [Phytophthora palmivora]
MDSPLLPRFILPMEKYEWISGFHNVQVPFEEHRSDFMRLSRRITGNAVGLVLGGGGARGLAHIGVLRALQECGIHVDVVGGTSIGAFIGGIYALHPNNLDLVASKVQQLSAGLSSIFEKLRDLTLPIISFFNGTRFNQSIRAHFYDLSIEDLMLNYFCVSTDIAKSRMSVHRSGPAWKYVRASMSLQGYFPPISENGSLLLDGGYMNNLPADVMKEEGGIKYIFAVDVASESRTDFYDYGSALSGWWLLWNKLNPFAKTVAVPSMGDVSAALAYVSSEQHKDRIKEEFIDLYLRPPVKDYGTLEFNKMEEIIEVGYNYALPRIKAWMTRVLDAEPDADIKQSTPPTTPPETPSSKLSKLSIKT